jgi:hypothetical protein
MRGRNAPITAGSAEGISPPAAHRIVHKSLDLHGSSQPFSCHLAMTRRRGKQNAHPDFSVGDHLLCAESSPSLHSHYKSFIALRDDPSPFMCIGTFPPSWFSLIRFSLGITCKVPKFHT